MMYKRGMQKFAVVALLLISIAIFSMYFVMGAHTVTKAGGGTTFYVTNIQTNFNITVLNGDTLNTTGNITWVNITFPSTISYNPGVSNNTDNSNYAFMTNSTGSGSNVLSFFNITYYLINFTKSGNFWFNATPNYGIHTLNITTYNQTGHGAQTLLTVISNDTSTAPNVTLSGASVVSRGNYSGTLTINVSVNDSFGLTYRVFFNFTNKTIGSVTVNATGVGVSAVNVINASIGGSGVELGPTYPQTNTTWWSASINTSLIPDGIYNITVDANDSYNNRNGSEIISNFVVDNTAPALVVNFTNTLTNYTNYTKGVAFHLNVTVVSAGYSNTSTVVFNVTNASGVQNVSISAIPQNDSKAISLQNALSWNATFNTSMLADGIYNISVIATDYAGNVNNTVVVRNLVVDNTGPTLTITKDTTATGKNNVEIDIALTDALVGIDTACTSDRPSASISGTTTTQTLTESSLNCGTTYTYIVKCKDRLGNYGASATLPVTTSGCSSGGSSSSGGGGSSTTTTWTSTTTIADQEFSSGVSKSLGAKQRVTVKVNGEDHHIGVKSLTSTKAVVEISSTPVTAELAIGEEKKVDVNSDGVYDVYVKLLSITNNKATLDIKKISEAIPQPPAPVEEVTAPIDDTPDQPVQPSPISSSGSSLWIWVILVILILVIIVVWVIVKRLRSPPNRKSRW